MSAPVISAGDRLRGIVEQLNRVRIADEGARVALKKGAEGWDEVDEFDAVRDAAVNMILGHLDALQRVGVLASLADAADVFDGGQA